MTTRISTSGVAVDQTYYWRPMAECPRGVKVQLLNPGGVAVYGTFNGKDDGWRGWAPLPKIRPSLDEDGLGAPLLHHHPERLPE